MAYNTTAKGLSALGRHGDNTLLHVGKDELVGKSNTTNLVTLLDAVVSIVTSGATVPLDNVNTLPRMFPGLSCCSIK
jgi:hypothetical protein